MTHRCRHSIRLLSAFCCGIALIAFPPDLSAQQQNKNNKNQPLSKKGNPAELPVVKHVTNTGITIGDKYFETDESTQVTVNGENGDLADIKVGMQASVTGGVLKYGKARADTVYKATRIIASTDNQLAKKAAEANKKAEQGNKANQRSRRK